jgi:hypothetical protein
MVNLNYNDIQYYIAARSSLNSNCTFAHMLDAYEYSARRLANLCVDMLNKREQMGDTPERAWLNTHVLLCKMARVILMC